jgi:hypothetical protein
MTDPVPKGNVVPLSSVTARQHYHGRWGPWRLNADNELVLPRTNGVGIPYYYVTLQRYRTSAQVLDVIAQVARKTWADDAVVAGLVCALDDVLRLQSNLCGCGEDHRLTPPKVRALVDAYRRERQITSDDLAQKRLREDEANALGFTVTQSRIEAWWDACSQANRPYVAVLYRRGRSKYAAIDGDDGPAHHYWSEPLEEGGVTNYWHQHEDRLRELTGLAAQRAIAAGYRGGIGSGAWSISTCLAADAVAVATVLVQVWDGDTTGLEALLSKWEH